MLRNVVAIALLGCKTNVSSCRGSVSRSTGCRSSRKVVMSAASGPKIINVQDKNLAAVERAVSEATAFLKDGGVIAVPTETVYGIAASAESSEAIERIYAIKGRNKDKPIAICLSDVSQIDTWANRTVGVELLKELLPGPVTTVFERRACLNADLNPGNKLVGIRIPDFPILTQLVSQFGCPLALTSANVSNTRSTLAIEEFQELWPLLDLIIDGGEIITDGPHARKGSTVVNLSVPGYFSIIREGSSFSDTVKTLEKHKLNPLQR